MTEQNGAVTITDHDGTSPAPEVVQRINIEVGEGPLADAVRAARQEMMSISSAAGIVEAPQPLQLVLDTDALQKTVIKALKKLPETYRASLVVRLRDRAAKEEAVANEMRKQADQLESDE